MIMHLDYERVPSPSIDHISDLQARSEPLRLYNSMKLGSSSMDYKLYSPSPITIGGVTIWSASPITIIRSTMTPRFPLEVTSTASLGSSFRDGWVKLPDELKERILSYNVVSHVAREGRRYAYGVVINRSAKFFHHLRSTAEIARLSRDLYYKHNSFQLEPTRIRPQQPFAAARPALRYPNSSVGQMIRSIHFVCAMESWAWESLTRFSRGVYGFSNLQFLKIIFHGKLYIGGQPNDAFDEFHDAVAINELRFACVGKLEVLDESVKYDVSLIFAGSVDPEVQETTETAWRRERMEVLLRRTIHFGCSESKRGLVP